MSNPAKQKGTAWETLLVNFLKALGFLGVYRPATAGAYDTGDINGIRNREGRQVIVQCKNHRKMNLSGWLNDTVEQAERKPSPDGVPAVPVLAVKRIGMGPAKVGKNYAILQMEDLAQLLQEAGYN